MAAQVGQPFQIVRISGISFDLIAQAVSLSGKSSKQ